MPHYFILNKDNAKPANAHASEFSIIQLIIEHRESGINIHTSTLVLIDKNAPLIDSPVAALMESILDTYTKEASAGFSVLWRCNFM